MHKFINYICYTFLVLISHRVTTAQNSCRTPSGSSGYCVPYRNCAWLTNLYEKYQGNLPPNVRNQIAALRCNEQQRDTIYICCESNQSNSPGGGESLNSKGLQILESLKCGESSVNRVAYGTPTKLREFPWMALLRYNTAENPFKCGGSLITNRYVLTAAHCIIGIKEVLVGVRLGEHDLNTEKDCQVRGSDKLDCNQPVEDYGVEKVIAHENYSKTKLNNDVALIRLDREVQFKSHIKPVCLPITKASAKEQPRDYILSGWGTTESGFTSNVLLKANLQYQELSYCQRTFTRIRIFDNQLCAGGEGISDSCKGDSGGPLFAFTAYKKLPTYVQYGIVSFGAGGCGNNGNIAYPGVYTSVLDFLPWITNNIN